MAVVIVVVVVVVAKMMIVSSAVFLGMALLVEQVVKLVMDAIPVQIF